MAKKWHNKNLPGSLHFVTGNVFKRRPIFTREEYCRAFLAELQDLRQTYFCKLIAFVLMPDHIHLILNPANGDIQTALGTLKSFSAKRIVKIAESGMFLSGDVNQVWQESFKALPMWSGWMIDQKINYIHANPVKANVCETAEDYPWTSFRSFYRDETDTLLEVDKNWWWEDDESKLVASMKEWEGEKNERLRLEIDKKKERWK